MANPTKRQVVTDIAQLYDRALITPAGCIEWQGTKTRGGYGAVRSDGKSIAVHRLICELEHGKPQERLFVLHSCDNPPCFNPEHLRWGTQSENTLDAIGRSRWANKQGANNGRSKLIETQIVEIRQLASQGLNTVKLAELYGVSNQLISRIVSRKAWTHVA